MILARPLHHASSRDFPAALLSILVVTFAAGIVTLFASGRLGVEQAGLLLVAPFLLALAVVRPEWTILVLVALPPFAIESVQPMRLLAVLLAAIFGFVLQGRLGLSRATGVLPLIGIFVSAAILRADVSGQALLVADGALKNLAYFVLLALVAFLAISNGRLSIDTFINALLVGLVVSAILEPIIGESWGFESITRTPYRGKFAYLAVMGFGVTYLRRVLGDPQRRSRLDAILMVAFLILTAIGFGRAAWIAGLWIFALGAIWMRSKSLLVAGSLLVALVLTVPVIGERVLPGGATNLADPERLALVTTGRSELWEELWNRGREALPLGHGWGYLPSLDSVQLFGLEGQFQSGGSTYVHAHNDFLYLFVELGLVGVGFLILFWLSLVNKIHVLSRSRSPSAGYGARILVPVVVTMFVVQLFDNGFAIRSVATRFFIAAGLILGLLCFDQERERSGSSGAGSPGTNRDSGQLDARSRTL